MKALPPISFRGPLHGGCKHAPLCRVSQRVFYERAPRQSAAQFFGATLQFLLSYLTSQGRSVQIKSSSRLRQRVANMTDDQFSRSLRRLRYSGRSILGIVLLFYGGLLWLYIEARPQCEAVSAFEAKYGGGNPLQSLTLTGQLQEITSTASNELARQQLPIEFEPIIRDAQSHWGSVRFQNAGYVLVPISYVAAWSSPENIGTKTFVGAGLAEGFFPLIVGGLLLLYATAMESIRKSLPDEFHR